MASIHSSKQSSNEQQGQGHSMSNSAPIDNDLIDNDATTELKHDGNKTNYANQVLIAVGDEEE